MSWLIWRSPHRRSGLVTHAVAQRIELSVRQKNFSEEEEAEAERSIDGLHLTTFI